MDNIHETGGRIISKMSAYKRRCWLCGNKAIGKRTIWVRGLGGWTTYKGYVCRECYRYWSEELKHAEENGEFSRTEKYELTKL